ncbi:type I-E CRISPR-associated protein Cas5/CasD [Kitasatospora sp. NBC_01287]|uniref:type I-E CRISPR-associated protein Cas5/CasD n=1 Tax=Kitasatospora sp. NBC_01287 TaxID=2903573 RepID=UPI00224E4A46|nr:type I-E CRISPR-associated protein Cas5/CasD [Kitasatospora sp. NBC_01287]MCX4750591.1 type I-E CRISPR-associated protein Cas5/CasD [Kitasatospora sp. NBC_01287]
MSTSPEPTTTDPAAPGLLLHLAGPLQSWGERSQFNQRDTAPFPTRSGVIGLLACALGRHRDEPIDDLARLSLTVRADRPGVLLRDLHTVGGGLRGRDTVTTADGKKRSGATATLLSHRYYLADAAFTAAVTGTDTDLLDRCAAALRAPRWPLYLGRRSCPPEGPLLIDLLEQPLQHLVQLPLAVRARNGEAGPVRVVFHGDQPLGRLPVARDAAEAADRTDADGTSPAGQVNDDPLGFHPRTRAYRARTRYQRTLTLPAAQCAGLGSAYLTALVTYLDQHTRHLERGHA